VLLSVNAVSLIIFYFINKEDFSHLINIVIERIMSTYTICLSSESNVSMLTAVNLNVVKLIIEALLSKIKEDSVSLLY